MLNDVLQNIISDAVMKVHRDEKMLRMQSAAIQAQQAAEKNSNGEPTSDQPHTTTKAGAAVAEDGKIYLCGNPLSTTTTITCANCRLPRLLSYPPEPKTEYCAKKPYLSIPNHDIHGNPFPSNKPTKSKPTKDASNPAITKKTTADSLPSSSPQSSNSPPNENPQNTTSTPTPSFPTTKCPNCPRYLVVTRIAQHLEKCMGIAGRQSSRNAMAKMSSDTPKNSRAGTPKPAVGNAAKKPEMKKRKWTKGDDDEDESTPKKKKKLGLKKRGAEKRPPPKLEEERAGETIKVGNREDKERKEEDKEPKGVKERNGDKEPKGGKERDGDKDRKEDKERMEDKKAEHGSGGEA